MNIAERGLLELYLVECLDEISKVLILQSGPPPLAIVFGNHAKRILGLRVRPKLKALTLDLTHIIKCAAWDSVEDVAENMLGPCVRWVLKQHIPRDFVDLPCSIKRQADVVECQA